MESTTRDFDEQLAEIPILASLSRRQRRKLIDASKVVLHQAGREVATEGEGALALHVLLSGRAVVSLRGSQLRELGPGDYFGEISMIDGKSRSATVTAAESMETLVVPHLAFRSLLKSDPDCAQGLLEQLCDRLRETESRQA